MVIFGGIELANTFSNARSSHPLPTFTGKDFDSEPMASSALLKPPIKKLPLWGVFFIGDPNGITALTALVRDMSLTGTLSFASRLYSNPFLWVQIPVVIITNKKSPCKRSFFLLVMLSKQITS